MPVLYTSLPNTLIILIRFLQLFPSFHSYANEFRSLANSATVFRILALCKNVFEFVKTKAALFSNYQTAYPVKNLLALMYWPTSEENAHCKYLFYFLKKKMVYF